MGRVCARAAVQLKIGEGGLPLPAELQPPAQGTLAELRGNPLRFTEPQMELGIPEHKAANHLARSAGIVKENYDMLVLCAIKRAGCQAADSGLVFSSDVLSLHSVSSWLSLRNESPSIANDDPQWTKSVPVIAGR